MLDRITPLILTFNEAPNIARSLAGLTWARDVVVVDSFSSDETLSLVRGFPNTRVFQRPFDSHAAQWNFGLHETGISTAWVLALDADFVVSEAIRDEIAALNPSAATGGYQGRFIYCVNGRALRATAYPPVTILYRRDGAVYEQDGHTQRIRCQGNVATLSEPLLHDDRKSLATWITAQSRYMRLEAMKLLNADRPLSWADRIRRARVIAPFAMLFYCLFVKGGILDGRAGLYYSLQRTVAEMLLSLYLLQDDLTRKRT